MTTSCQLCGAVLLRRQHLHRQGDPLLMVETYACGAVGTIDAARRLTGDCLRECRRRGLDQPDRER